MKYIFSFVDTIRYSLTYSFSLQYSIMDPMEEPMKKAVLLFAVLCVLSGAVSAQQIRPSPLEGRWVWDGKGEEPPDCSELIFFGNVALFTEEGLPVYQGVSFAHKAGIISFGDNDLEWKYRVFGNLLTIIDEEEKNFSYKKANMRKSPIEGIWKITGGVDYDPDEDQYLIFVGDLMVMEDGDGYIGFTIDFKGRVFHPSLNFFQQELGEDATDEELMEMAMEYRISGRTLNLTHEEEDVVLTKVY